VLAEWALDLAWPNPLQAFFFWNRTRREIALRPYLVWSAVADVVCPYLDHDLVDHLAGLPVTMTSDHEFHVDAIAAAHPDVDVPYALTGWDLDRLYGKAAGSNQVPWHFRRFHAEALRFVATRRRSSTVPLAYLVPRLAKRVLDGTQIQRRLHPAMYLLQLEAAVDAARAGTEAQ
jgi:hypothetical protein